jgi:diacylglycerol kinase
MKINRLKKSLSDAIRGIVNVFQIEQNFRIQVLVAVFVVALMLVLRVSKAEMIVLLLLIVAVLTLELLNSALERFVDLLKPRLHLQVGAVKDIMAAMVLLVSLGALVIGLLIFWPYLFL